MRHVRRGLLTLAVVILASGCGRDTPDRDEVHTCPALGCESGITFLTPTP